MSGPDGTHRGGRHRDLVDFALEQLTGALSLAVAMLLMVVAGHGKGRLEWRPRPPFWRRWWPR